VEKWPKSVAMEDRGPEHRAAISDPSARKYEKGNN